MDKQKSGESMNIYQRINEVRKAIGYIQKDKAVSTGGGSYKAVTHDAVTGLVRQHLVDKGVVIVPTMVESKFNEREEGAKQRLYEATYNVQFINMDQPEEMVSVMIQAHALDNGDKAPGKAISYATKYAILKLFNLETGEDEESRYQREEFDVTPFIDALRACKTFDELKAAYQQYLPDVRASEDREAIQTFAKVKDAEKARLDKESAQ